MGIRRKLAGAAAAAATMLSLIVVAPAPAMAVGEGCYGSGTASRPTCTGKDPQTMGCDVDATTLETIYYWVKIELRYSSACYAAWTRYSNGLGSTGTAFIRGSANTYSKNAAGYVGEVGWTRMVSFSQVVRSCFMKWNEGEQQYYEECTRSR